MKKTTTYLLVILVLGVSLQSCKKDDAGTSTAYPSGQGRFTATGGLTLDLTGVFSSFTRKTTSSYDSIYVGGLTTTSVVGLNFVNVKTATTLPLNTQTSTQTAIAGYFTGYNASSDYYLSTSSTTPGTVTITAISATAIEGTYTTSVKNAAGTTISFSGTFKGSF